MDLHQIIMDKAYDRWQTGWSKDRFWLSLNFPERVAVLTGNLNYQVGNGGFSQWHFNMYSECAKDLLLILEIIDTETTKKVAALVREVMDIIEKDSRNLENLDLVLDKYDTSFYEISKDFLRDVNDFLKHKKTTLKKG